MLIHSLPKKRLFILIWQSAIISILFVTHLVFSYYYFDGWWYSSIGTFLILFFSFLLWKKKFPLVTGIRIRGITLIKVILLTAIILTVSYLLMNFSAGKKGISIAFSSVYNYYHDVFYIINEEIVYGAILLYFLIQKYKINKIVASIGLALVFSAGHFILYKWVFLQTGILSIKTLTVLFLIGILRNNLIILSKHIGYSWALHFGWMAVMFGSVPFWLESGEGLTEPERFNIFLGTNFMLFVSSFLAGLSIYYLAKSKK